MTEYLSPDCHEKLKHLEKTLLELRALLISQQPTLMTSLTALRPSQFIAQLGDNYSHKIPSLSMTNQSKTQQHSTFKQNIFSKP